MILKISGADFSNVKIGTITEIPDALQAAVEAFGNLTRKETNALIAMYNSLSSGGYWSKIDRLYIPIISSSLAKTHVNIIDGNVDFVPSSEFELNERGIHGLSRNAAWTGSPISVESKSVANTSTFIICDKTEEYTEETSMYKTNYGLCLQNDNSRSFYYYLSGNILMYAQSDKLGLSASYKEISIPSSGNIFLLASIGESAVNLYSGDDTLECTISKTGITYNKIAPYLCYYNDASKVVTDIRATKMSGIFNSEISQEEYSELTTIFETFLAAIK